MLSGEAERCCHECILRPPGPQRSPRLLVGGREWGAGMERARDGKGMKGGEGKKGREREKGGDENEI